MLIVQLPRGYRKLQSADLNPHSWAPVANFIVLHKPIKPRADPRLAVRAGDVGHASPLHVKTLPSVQRLLLGRLELLQSPQWL